MNAIVSVKFNRFLINLCGAALVAIGLWYATPSASAGGPNGQRPNVPNTFPNQYPVQQPNVPNTFPNDFPRDPRLILPNNFPPVLRPNVPVFPNNNQPRPLGGDRPLR